MQFRRCLCPQECSLPGSLTTQVMSVDLLNAMGFLTQEREVIQNLIRVLIMIYASYQVQPKIQLSHTSGAKRV